MDKLKALFLSFIKIWFSVPGDMRFYCAIHVGWRTPSSNRKYLGMYTGNYIIGQVSLRGVIEGQRWQWLCHILSVAQYCVAP